MELKSFVIIEKNEKFLLVKDSSSNGKGKWFFPGGALTSNESFEEAAMRETKEETLYEVILMDLVTVEIRKKTFRNAVTVFFTGVCPTIGPVKEPDENSEAAYWFTFEEIKNLPVREDVIGKINAANGTKARLPVLVIR